MPLQPASSPTRVSVALDQSRIWESLPMVTATVQPIGSQQTVTEIPEHRTLPRCSCHAVWQIRKLLQGLGNPSSAHHQVVLIEHDGLSGGDGALRIVEGDQRLAVGQGLDSGRRGLMAMANLG